METDALIQALARDTARIPRHALERRLAAGSLVGGMAALLLVVGWLGLRPDLAEAAGTAAFWGKAGYTLSLGIAGLVLAAQLARPDTDRLRWVWLAAVPPALLVVPAAAELADPSSERAALILGPSWTCLPLILTLAAPVYVGLVWAFRRLAPTRLAAAGAAAGLAAGGIGATLYGLYCQQVSPTHILTHYTLAVALACAAGALLGPRLMRW